MIALPGGAFSIKNVEGVDIRDNFNGNPKGITLKNNSYNPHSTHWGMKRYGKVKKVKIKYGNEERGQC